MKTFLKFKKSIAMLLSLTMLTSMATPVFAETQTDVYGSQIIEIPEDTVSTDAEDTLADDGLIMPILDDIDPASDEWIKDHTITVTSNGQEYTSEDTDIPYQEDDNLIILFEWVLKNGQSLPKQFKYPLNDFKLDDGYTGGYLYNQHQDKVGTWTVVTEDDIETVVFTFDDWFRKDYVIDRSFWMKLEGIVPLDPDKDKDRDDKGFKFGEEWFDLDPTYREGGIDLTKDVTNVQLDPDGYLIYTFNITATVSGYVKDLELVDYIKNNDGIPFYNISYGNDFKLTLNGKTLSNTDYKITSIGDNSTSPKFTVTFGDRRFNQGDKITLTYTYKVKVEGAWLDSPNVSYSSGDNVIDASGTDVPTDSKIDSIPKEAPLDIPDIKLQVNKSGSRNENDPSRIDWTVDIDTGIKATNGASKPNIKNFVNIIYHIINSKYSNLQFIDTLGEGHSFASQPPNGAFRSLISNMELVVVNGQWRIVFKHQTVITDESMKEYTNTISIKDGYDNITSKGPVGVPNYILTKSKFDNEPILDGNDRVMRWKISTFIPQSVYSNNKPFDTFQIVDEVQQSPDYPDYWHKYREGTLQVYLSKDGTSPDSLLWDGTGTVPTWLKIGITDNGFTLDISYSPILFTNANYKYLVFIYETEVLDNRGNNVDFIDDEYYYWTNNASLPKADLTDSDSYIKTIIVPKSPKIAKNVRSYWDTNTNSRVYYTKDENNNYIFDWSIREIAIPLITNNFEFNRDDYFSLNLEDILPAGHEYVDGSLVIELNKGTSWTTASTSNPTATSLIKYEDIPELSNWLSSTLKCTSMEDDSTTGQKRLNITWEMPDETNFPGIQEVLDYYTNNTSVKPADMYLTLTYRTRLVDESSLIRANSGNVSFTNTVVGNANDSDIGKVTASASVRPESFGGKSYAYKRDYNENEYPGETQWMYTIDDTGTSIPNMRFSIDINKSAVKLSADEPGTVFVTDTMGSGLDLIMNSIQVLNVRTGEYVDTNELNINFDKTKNELTMQVPGGEYYVLSYWTKVIGEEGAKLTKDHGNSVFIEMADKNASYSSSAEGNIYISAAGAKAAKLYDLEVEKEVTGNMGNKVQGFKFTLELSTDDDNLIVPSTLDYIKNEGTENEETGVFTLINGKCEFTLRHTDTIIIKDILEGLDYKLTENITDYKTEITSTDRPDTITGKEITGKIADDFKIKYTNTKDSAVPTDATNRYLWSIPLILLPIAYLVIKKRKKF